MKAFRRYARDARAARLVDHPIPTPKDNEVLLRVAHCGICGSDLHAWLNHKGYESVLPEVTFGHEFSATVTDTGSRVTNWKTGDQAVMIALQTHHDDNDPYCRMGLPQLSSRRRVQGLHLDGGMAEYVCVEEEFLLPIPDGLDLELAALTEPLSVAEHCIGNRTSIGPDDKVIVSGPGIIGLLCAISARSRGAEVIISGTERDEATRLTAARTIGFETLVVGPGHPPLHNRSPPIFLTGPTPSWKHPARLMPWRMPGNRYMPTVPSPPSPSTPALLISTSPSFSANRSIFVPVTRHPKMIISEPSNCFRTERSMLRY